MRPTRREEAERAVHGVLAGLLLGLVLVWLSGRARAGDRRVSP